MAGEGCSRSGDSRCQDPSRSEPGEGMVRKLARLEPGSKGAAGRSAQERWGACPAGPWARDFIAACDGKPQRI